MTAGAATAVVHFGMEVWRQSRPSQAAAWLAVAWMVLTSTSAVFAKVAIAQDGVPGAASPNYLTSPYHGMRDGDGRIIPCRCRFDGRDFRVGEAVCMNTHMGTVIARCDLQLNNTSWIATGTPCELSYLSGRADQSVWLDVKERSAPVR